MSSTFSQYVFVYGTLKRAYGNNKLLRDSEFIGTYETTELFFLGDVGYPYAFEASLLEDHEEKEELLKPVLGELFHVTEPKVAASLDCLEGYSEGCEWNHYDKRQVSLAGTDITPMMYTQPRLITTNGVRYCKSYEGAWTWEP